MNVQTYNYNRNIDYLYNDYPISDSNLTLSHENRFEKLVEENNHLFNSGSFFPMEGQYYYAADVDVGMDRFIVTLANLNTSLGTSGLSTCIAVCGKGTNQNGQTYLALAHTSSLESNPEEVLYLLTSELKARGCLGQTVEFHLIGGSLDPECDSINAQETFVELSKKYPIKSVRFNIVSESDSSDEDVEALSVVFSQRGIFYSKREDFFKTMEPQLISKQFWPIFY